MKITYTPPELSSINDNRIVDIFSIGTIPYEVRILTLIGNAVRIEINKDGYVELKSVVDLDLSKYNEIFKELQEFFYGTAYLYGNFNDGKLEIYDVFTNDNFLSTRDLNFLKKHYNLPLAEPKYEGYIYSMSDALDKLKQIDGYDESSIFILPAVYINDKREEPKITSTIKEKVILGEKKVYPVWNGTYNTYNAYNAYNANAINTVSTKKEEKTKKFLPEVFKLVDKKQRESIFNETYLNISEYIKTIKLTDNEKKWWDKYGKLYTHLYAIHTLPETRKLVYEYTEQFVLPWNYYNYENSYKWAILFTEMFDDIYYDNFLEPKNIIITAMDVDNFEKIFHQELNEFNKFYEAEIKTSIGDWRIGTNFDDNDYYEGIYDCLYS